MGSRLLLLPLAAAGIQAAVGDVVGRDRLPDSLSPSLPTKSSPAMEPPVPTNPPRPNLASIELLKRAGGDKTCGYLHSGWDPNRPLFPVTCVDPGYICTNSGSIRDCCHSTECSTSAFATACLDSTACLQRGVGTYCCTFSSVRGYCTSYLWSSDQASTYTFFNCGSATTSRVLVLTASDGTGSSSTDSDGVTSSFVLSTTTPSSTTSSTTRSASPTTTDQASSQATPVGPIVGGVVGGLAVIGIAVLAVFFILRRDKKPKSPTGAPPAQPYPPPPMGQHPPPQPYPSPSPAMGSSYPGSPDPNYNPHYSLVPSASPGPGYPYAAPLSPDPTGSSSVSPHHMGQSPMGTDPMGQSPKPALDSVAEAPANNPIGTGNNRAELG